MDAQLLGDSAAYSLGVDVQRLRNRLIGWASLLVGLAVSSAGMIGFVGLLVPHWVRRQFDGGHRVWIPMCAVLGALILVVSDWVARTLFSPIEIPVGVVTALLGAPVFGWFVLRERWQREAP